MKVKVLIILKFFEPKLLPRIDERAERVKKSEKGQLIRNSGENFTSQQVNFETISENVSFSTKTARITKKSSTVSVALPKTQSIYTVLRSPHIDKKSREQFELSVCKQLIILNTEIKHIQEKLFNLRFHEIPGVQMKVILQTKTRLNFQKTL